MIAPTRTSERALGLVEVIIAAVITLLAGIVLVNLATSSGTAISRADAQRVQAEVARSVVRQLSAEQSSWEKSKTECATAQTCDLTSLVASAPYLTHKSGKGTVQLTANVTARGVDSEIDGTGPADADRRVPDWYELKVVVHMPPGRLAVQPYELVAETDSVTRGAGGILVVRACRAVDQADDRIDLGACEARQQIPLARPAGNGVLDRDLTAWEKAPAEMKMVTIEPVALSCTATRTGADPLKIQITTGADGAGTSEKAVPPGDWNVACPAPNGSVPWKSHTRPAGGMIRVERGRTSTAMFAFEPAPVDVTIRQGTIHFATERVCVTKPKDPANPTGPKEPEVCDWETAARFEARSEHPNSAPLEIEAGLVPSPYGRVPVGARATGVEQLILADVRPGLYAGSLVSVSAAEQYYTYSARPGSGTLPLEFGTPLEWVWVDKGGQLQMSPQGDGTLWQVRWWCHDEFEYQAKCTDGPTPSGRGSLAVGGAGGTGGA